MIMHIILTKGVYDIQLKTRKTYIWSWKGRFFWFMNGNHRLSDVAERLE